MNAGWPGSCGFLPGSPREPSRLIPSGPLSPRSFFWGDPGIPEATQDPEQGSVCPRAPSRGGCHSQLPPGRPSCPSSFLLPAGSASLALEPRTFQKADLRVAQTASREGAGRAPALLTSPARPDPDAAAGSRQPPPRHHPGHLPPGPKGSPGGVTAQRPR